MGVARGFENENPRYLIQTRHWAATFLSSHCVFANWSTLNALFPVESSNASTFAFGLSRPSF